MYRNVGNTGYLHYKMRQQVSMAILFMLSAALIKSSINMPKGYTYTNRDSYNMVILEITGYATITQNKNTFARAKKMQILVSMLPKDCT